MFRLLRPMTINGHDAAMQVFELSKWFPKEETYALTDQARSGLKDLADKHAALNTLIDAQLAKLS